MTVGAGPNQPRNGVWPSPFNWSAGAPTSRRIYIADCTLRDGEQQPGVALDRVAKVEIAQALDSLGAYEIEAGTPASSREDQDSVAGIAALGLRAKISVLVRATREDIDLSRSLGAWGVRISLPISQIERKHKLKGISNDAYLEKALETTAYAKDTGAHVIFSPYDTTRADLEFLLRVVTELQRAATVDRLRIVDTAGCALPDGVAALVTAVRGAAPTIPIEVHCHDDFGLACANTVAGVAAGADYVSSTINGLGERSGNAATEEVAMALEGLHYHDTGLDLSRLADVSRLVARLSGVEVQPHKAVIGQNAFRHETGMVVAGVIRDPFTAEPYDPAIVGQKRQIVVGKTSGLASIAYKAEELDLRVPAEALAALLSEVKDASIRHRRSLTDAEFADLAARHAG